jgi:alkanesulfonate monooxygenase SsuD/methylene tetrahydromethanopterin reductase-like flavin-dependent oxidoreductase (luciferase family)
MKFGFAIPAYGPGTAGEVVRDLIAAGEDLGYDSVWLPDHIAVPAYAAEANLKPPFLEPIAIAAWGLGATKRLRFGTDVLVAPYRHPLLVAAMAGSLVRVAGPRLVLGVGVGYLRGEFEALGTAPYESRGATTDGFLRTFRSPPTDLSVMPVDDVPLWVGGNGAPARRRAAAFGDGWHPLWMPAADYAAARADILEQRAALGRDTPFTFSYSSGGTRVLDRDPGTWPAPRDRAPESSEFRYAPAPLVHANNRPYFVGTPEQVIADVRELEAAGVDFVTLRFATTDTEQLETFAREILPAF